MSSQAPVVAAPAAQQSQPLSSTTGACCDSGRPILTDPLTGQTVCSCQYDTQTQQILNYQRLASSFPLNVYGAPYGEQGYLPLTAEQSAFYSPTENIGAWPYPASMYYPYDPTLSGYPFPNGYGVDVNGARRKNATRETTSTLKAWLNEHRKNPYPTKGEKIMLAIITKMTLTQVSTWFANARRRLKKDNKVTWEPRNRVDDDDDDGAASDTNERESSGKGLLDKDNKQTNENGYGSSCHKAGVTMSRGLLEGSTPHHHLLHQNPLGGPGSGDDDDMCLGGNGNGGRTSQRDSMSSPGSSIMSDSHSPLASPASTPGHSTMQSGVGPGGSEPPGGALKPRIWSIVDTATSHHGNHGVFGGSSGMYSGYGPGVGMYPANGSGGPAALKASQQLARNFRLGYASPYGKTVWRNGAFATVAPPSSTAVSSTTNTATTGAPVPPSPCYSSPPPLPISGSMSSTSGQPVSPSSSRSSPAAAPSSTTTLTSGQPAGADACGSLMLSPMMKSNLMAAAAASSVATNTGGAPSYPMANASAAMNSMGSSLFSRTYAQTIHNLTNLTKGLNHLMTPSSIGGSYVGSVKATPVQQDQRPEIQTSTS